MPSTIGERIARTLLGRYLRRRDLEGAAGVDKFVAISHEVSRRIMRIYGQPAEVIEAPTPTAKFGLRRMPGDNYLVVSRLLRYKRIEVAILACNAIRRKLTVVGEGPERKALEAIAGPTVKFVGHVPDIEVAALMASARAVIVCAEEDWGMVAIEAAAAGCPAIAANAGGNRETVIDGVTGILFGEPYGPNELADALLVLEKSHPFAIETMQRHARRFDDHVFAERLRRLVSREMMLKQSGGQYYEPGRTPAAPC